MSEKIKQLWLQYFDQATDTDKFRISIGALLLYVLAFAICYPQQGVNVTAFTIIPVAVIAWYYGWRGGLVSTLASFGLNTLLLNIVGLSGITIIFDTGAGPNFIALMVIALAIGKISESYKTQKQAYEILSQEHNLLTTIVDHIPIEVFAKDRESRFIFANASTRQALHITNHENYLGKTDFDFMAHKLDEAQLHYDNEQNIMRTGVAQLDQEFTGPTPEGKQVWIMSSKMPYYNAKGEIIGIIGTNRSITESKEMNDALQQSEASLLMALEAAEMRTWHWDLVKNQVSVKGVSLPGFTRANYQITYPEFLKGVHEEDRKSLQQTFNNVIENGIPYNVEYRVTASDGETHWIASKGNVEHDENGKPISINGVSFDITEHKHAEEQRLELAIERERMQVLTSFITQASHEFKTPLSIISTSTYILQNTDNPDKQQHYFQQINEQVKSITQLIENLTTLSKLDSGQIMTVETIDLNQMLRDIYRSKEAQFREHHINSSFDKSDKPIFVYGNIDYIGQALEHILDNALRYTPAGASISMGSQLIDKTAILEIRDTGIGISPDDLPQVFSRFYRADKAGSTRGFGLGLPIAKAIIEGFGGQIDVSSELDQGSVFRISFPVAESSEAMF